MKIIRYLKNFSTKNKSVITIGSFDGVHLGHRSLLIKAMQIAKKNKLTPYVLFFEPIPKEYFITNQAPGRIYDIRNKIINLKKIGIKNIICLRFNSRFANILAEDFIRDFLVSKLKAKHIIIGNDFKFGRKRLGNYDMLRNLSKIYNFKVEKVLDFNVANMKVSSTKIRKALNDKNLTKATNLLGNTIKLNGRVIQGQKNGRKIGFHTANLRLSKNSIIRGVYFTRVYIDNEIYYGITNAGTRPTIDGKNHMLETHVFDFNREIYSQHITIEILNFIRDEKKFHSVEELKNQIQQDITIAKKLMYS